MLQYKGQTFPFVVLPTYNFENFKIGIESTNESTENIGGNMDLGTVYVDRRSRRTRRNRYAVLSSLLS